MRKAVLDTNQLVSSLLSTRGPQRLLIEAWWDRKFILFLCPGQVEEVAEVLSRPKIRKKYPIPAEDREAFLRLLRLDAFLLADAQAPGICRDSDDDYLLGCAATGGAEYLVTGDKDLLTVGRYQGVTVLRAREFLAILSP